MANLIIIKQDNEKRFNYLNRKSKRFKRQIKEIRKCYVINVIKVEKNNMAQFMKVKLVISVEKS